MNGKNKHFYHSTDKIKKEYSYKPDIENETDNNIYATNI